MLHFYGSNQIKERLLLTEFFFENYILATELKEKKNYPDLNHSLD